MLSQALNPQTNVLSGKKYKVVDLKGRNIYLTIADCPVVGTPLELWITLPDENKPSEQQLKTDIVTLVTLFTEARQAGAKYTKLLAAMERVSYHKYAISSQIVKLLKTHCPVDKARGLEFEFASQKQANDSHLSEKEDVKLQ
jgi:hypothetical protein